MRSQIKEPKTNTRKCVQIKETKTNTRKCVQI